MVRAEPIRSTASQEPIRRPRALTVGLSIVVLTVAVLQTAGQLVLCGLAGYGLARIPYRYANVVLHLVIATLMIPAAVTFVPAFVVVSTLGWVSDLRGLVIPGLFGGFTAFLFRQYFLNFPRELEDASQIDGLGHWGTYWRIVVPNSKGFFAALGVIAEAVTAIVLADAMLEKFGGDSLAEMRRNYEGYLSALGARWAALRETAPD